ncbi:hypothetical protein [Nitrosopumilus sp.]|uniref:hypothetical protein n=1 Tax=Nitrosopumilus sp. TaxID=2024843 RepID=UPI0034A04BD7
MSVSIKQKNGNRYGTFDIMGIKGSFPNQVITSTNLNHAKFVHSSKFDFKTQFLEIVERHPKQIISDKDYRNRRQKIISEIIEQNSDKLCTLVISGAKSMSIQKDKNIALIEFQKECGFKLIKAFFKTSRNALENFKEYITLIPKECKIVPVIDENLNHSIFKLLYSNSLGRGLEIIGFFGREPKATNEDNKLNLQYISSREGDQIIRLVSSIKKSFGGVVSSLVYHQYGFDTYSFITRFGNPNIPVIELKALHQFHFKPLTYSSGLTCVITKNNLHTVANIYLKQNRSSVPISIHDIRKLNEEFATLHEKYSKEELEQIIKEKN